MKPILLSIRLHARQVVVLLALVVGSLFVALFSYGFYRAYETRIEEASARTQDLTRLLETHARLSLQRVEGYVARAADSVLAVGDLSRADLSALRLRLREQLPVDGLIGAFSVIDRDGVGVVATVTESGLPTAANRDYFVAQRERADLGMVIGAPVKSRVDGRWILPVSYRLAAPGGAFRGVLLAAVDPAYFNTFYDSIDTGASGFVTLFDRQGWIVARSPFDEAVASRDWAGSPMFRLHLPASATGTVRQLVAADGVERIYSYRALKEYPVIVTLGLSLTEILAPWRVRFWILGIGLLIVLAALGGAAWALTRQLRQREEMEIALIATKLRLEMALEGSQVSVWESDLRSNEVWLDPSWAVYLGKPRAETRTTSRELPMIAHPDDRQPIAETAVQFMKDEISSYAIEHRVKSESGEWRWILSRGRVIERDAGGLPLRLSRTNTDITERKQAEEQLATLNAELETRIELRTAELATTTQALQRALQENETELRFTTDRLQLALAASKIMFWDYDTRSGEVLLSEGWTQFMGYPPGETRTTINAMKALRHPTELERSVKLSTEALQGICEEYSAEHRVLTGSGEWRWVLLRAQVVERDAGGRALRMVGTNLDITDRKLAEQRVAASEDRLRTILDTAPAAIGFFDRDEKLMGANRRYAQWGEDIHSDVIGHTVKEVLGEQAYADFKPYLARVFAGEQIGYESRRVLQDGTSRELRIECVPHYDAAGRVAGGLSMVVDVTDLKEAQRAVVRSESRFRAIFEHSETGIALFGPDTFYQLVNAAYCRLTGYTAEELIGRMTIEDTMLPADIDEGTKMREDIRSGAIQHTRRERRLLRQDRSNIWVNSSAVAIPGSEGQPGHVLHVLHVLVDLTSTYQARERMQRHNVDLEERVADRTEELRTAAKELEAFTYTVSHDLRAPLGAINGFVHLLRAKESARLSEDGLKLLSFVETNATHMVALIEGLLEFSRLGRQALTVRTVPMGEMAGTTLAELQAGQQAVIDLQLLPDCQGDTLLLTQVWTNLISNALKYSRGRKPARIEIGYETAQSAYYVRDNGAGFDMRHAGKLFGVFERLHSDSEFMGTGLGLAIVDNIVRRHGGRVWAEAVPNEGATFHFTVPPPSKAHIAFR